MPPRQQLPQFRSRVGLPGTSGLVNISPEGVSQVPKAIGQAGETLEKTGLQAANVFFSLEEKERIAKEALERAKKSAAEKAGREENALRNKELKAIRETKAMEYGQKLDEEFGALKEELGQTDSNYEKWGPELSEKAKKIKDKYQDQLGIDGGADRQLGITGNKLYNHYLNDFNANLRVRRLKIINERGQGAFLKERDKMLDEYTTETDPVKRDFKLKVFNAELDYLTGTTWTAEKAQSLKDSFKRDASDLADVKADKMIETDPVRASIDLRDSRILSDLQPKQRQDKIEKAIATSKILVNEQEKKLKEKEKLAHDDQERKIEGFIRQEDFTKAYSSSTSPLLSGDEQAKWRKDIENISKVKEDDIDPVIESSNYAFVNELIAKEVDPKTIRNYIMSYEFKKGTREKLLDRLDTEVDKAVNKAKSRAYNYMKSQIMPYEGEQAPVPRWQSNNYTKAMDSLDDWIKEQRKKDKPITEKDIRMKSEELASIFQIQIAERQDITAKENKEYFESLKKKKVEKVEPSPTQPVEKYELNKVYTDSEGRKAKYLGGGKWQLVK